MAESRIQPAPLYYHLDGDPRRPALMLLHGFTGSHESLGGLRQYLSSHFYVISPDLPGHGQSLIPSDDFSMVRTAERLEALVQRLDVEHLSLYGYSMGGRQALHLALRIPSQIDSLVLESASPGLVTPAERAARRAQDETLADNILTRGLEWFVPYWSSLPLFKTEGVSAQESLNLIRYNQSGAGLAQSLREAGTGAQASLWEELALVSMPVLLVTGSRDHKFTAIAEAMKDRLPRATQVVIEGAGHTVHQDRIPEVGSLLLRFLKETSQPDEGTTVSSSRSHPRA